MKFFFAVVLSASAVFVELSSSLPIDNPPTNALQSDPKKTELSKNSDSITLPIYYVPHDAPRRDAKTNGQSNLGPLEKQNAHHEHRGHHGHHKHHDHQVQYGLDHPEKTEQPQQQEKPEKSGQIKKPEEIKTPGSTDKSGQIGTIPEEPFIPISQKD